MNTFDISPLTWEGLLCCFLSGVIIGLERQLRGKPVGVRTSALICTGTYVFIAMTRHISTDATDPSRIIGQVVTGIGFLGAGVILTRQGVVVGVTSASAIWVLAAIGVAIGLDYPWLGVKVALLTVVILVGVDVLESRFEALQRGVHRRLQPPRGSKHRPSAHHTKDKQQKTHPVTAHHAQSLHM